MESAQPKFASSCRGSHGCSGEGKGRAPEMATKGLKSFPGARLPEAGWADGKGEREERGKDFCPGRAIKGKKWNNNF